MNIIDTRDLAKRQQELQDELEILSESFDDAKLLLDDCDEFSEDEAECRSKLANAHQELQELIESDEHKELEELNELEEEIGSEWSSGETMIEEYDFKEYAQEMAEDCGMLDNATTWPLNCIDWEHAARELAYDYMMVEYKGDNYYVRAS